MRFDLPSRMANILGGHWPVRFWVRRKGNCYHCVAAPEVAIATILKLLLRELLGSVSIVPYAVVPAVFFYRCHNRYCYFSLFVFHVTAAAAAITAIDIVATNLVASPNVVPANSSSYNFY